MGCNDKRAAVLFEIVRVQDTILTLGKKCSLRVCVDFGFGDQAGNKIRSYQEYRYPSKEYKNTDHSITVNRKCEPFILFTYPSQKDGIDITGKFYIRPYSMRGLIEKMKEFDSKLYGAFFFDKNEECQIKSSKITPIESHPVKNEVIEFSQDLYVTDSDREPGVRIGFNNEYWITIKASTAWQTIMYFFEKFDLFGYSIEMMNWYSNILLGNSVEDVGSGNFSSSRSYSRHFEADPDDILEAEETVKVVRKKPLTDSEKEKSFFDAL